MKVIGVVENYLSTDYVQIVYIQTFYRCLRTDWHKFRRFNITMISLNHTRPRAGVFVLMSEGEKSHSRAILLFFDGEIKAGTIFSYFLIHCVCMRSCRLFNFICISVSAFFAGAILLVWRGAFVAHPVEMVGDIPLIKREEILEKEISAIALTTNTVVPEVAADSQLSGRLTLDQNDINLDIPYTSQAPERDWSQPWQDACEEAAVLMLDAYYKGYNLSPLFAKDEMKKMIEWEEARGWGSSIPIERVKILAQDYLKLKGKVKIIENPTVEIIKEHVSEGHPVLAVASGKILKNPYYSNGGPTYHALIIRGFTKDKFITNDPGVNRGRNFVFPIDNVMEAIHDWNGGDVPAGRKVVLVVE